VCPAIQRGADKSLAFPIFLFAAQLKEFFLDGLKKLEQRIISVWSSGGICGVNTFFSVLKLVVFFIKPKTYQPPSYIRPICMYTMNRITR
jgi:hypothetical protein